MSFFYSIEFYVILAVTAAAIIAFASRPESAMPVQEYLLAGDVSDEEEGADESIELECLDNGKILLRRRQVMGLMEAGSAVSMAVKVKGTDVSIEERLTFGRGLLQAPVRASFVIDFLPPGRYHIRYNSEKSGLFAAFSFTVKPGIRTKRELAR